MIFRIVWFPTGHSRLFRQPFYRQLGKVSDGQSNRRLPDGGQVIRPKRIPRYGFDMEIVKGNHAVNFFPGDFGEPDRRRRLVPRRKGRGMCSVVDSGKKGAEFRGLESPYQLAEKMRAAGYKAE